MLAEVSVWLCWVSVGQLRHGWRIVHCEAFVHRWPPPLPRPLLYIFFSIIFLSPKLDGLLFHFNECLFDQVCKQASKICHLSSDQPSLDSISAAHKHTCIDCWDGWCAHICSHTGFSVQANKKKHESKRICSFFRLLENCQPNALFAAQIYERNMGLKKHFYGVFFPILFGWLKRRPTRYLCPQHTPNCHRPATNKCLVQVFR